MSASVNRKSKGFSQSTALKSSSSISQSGENFMSSLEEMKPSQVLREALKLMDGGKKWIQGRLFRHEGCCSNGALMRATDAYPENYYPAKAFLQKTIANRFV